MGNSSCHGYKFLVLLLVGASGCHGNKASVEGEESMPCTMQ